MHIAGFLFIYQRPIELPLQPDVWHVMLLFVLSALVNVVRADSFSFQKYALKIP